MKRPEGFDPVAENPPPSSSRRRSVGRPDSKPKQLEKISPARSRGASSERVSTARVSSARARPDVEGSRVIRRTARDRRRFERAEVRRFTRRARTRRRTAAAAVGVVATLVGIIVGAVFSPFLALRVIAVDGTARVSAEQVEGAVAGQIGTPLALIDFATITRQLGAFPLIRSYVTEIVPPHTLVLHVTERQPIGTIQAGSSFQLVDPAGVVVQESPERVPGLPLILTAGVAGQGAGFESVVQVLLALPPETFAQVDSVSANTRDDVSLVLTGVGQRVKWGSAENSATKAVLLSALIAATDPSRAGEFDVSAPSNGVFRPA